ncbi:MAG: calcium/sodium antiporter [Planctomycetaceae bacterium]
MTNVIMLIAGLIVLLLGGELLVRGASKIAAVLGMSNLMIGLTVVSFGTSAPELAVCLDAVFSGTPELALGNIVGSNIANVLLILGVTACLYPIVVSRRIVWAEVPVMIGVSLLFLFLVLDRTLTRTDGIILLSAMVLFLVWQFWSEKKRESGNPDSESEDAEIELPRGKAKWLSSGGSIMLVVIGVAMLWRGANWMVEAATEIATVMGVSQLVIGLTIVAVGSSLPEIVTAILATKKGHPEMAVGSVVGSNIANLLVVGGVMGTFSNTISVPSELLTFNIPIMLACAVACLPVFITGHKIDRWEGATFATLFFLFTGYLILEPRLPDLKAIEASTLAIIIGVLVASTIAAILFAKKRNKRSA